MTPLITPEMRQALAENPRHPVYVLDSATKETYVLVPAGTFEKVQAFLYDGEPNPDEFLPLIHEALEDAWDAPGMEAYDSIPGEDA